MPHKSFRCALTLSIIAIVSSSLNASPMLNPQDPMPIHTAYGTDKFFKNNDKTHFTLHVSPYFQHTSTANNGDLTLTAKGSKVPAGNIDGQWNMAAIFFNKPTTTGQTNLTNYNMAMQTLQSGPVTSAVGKNLTDSALFDLAQNPLDAVAVYKRVDVTYEKLGIRGQMSFDIGYGLGVAVKGGFANYKQIPVFTTDTILQTALGSAKTPTDATATTPAAPTLSPDAAKAIQTKVMSTTARNAIAKELGLDLSGQRDTDVEDVHVNAYWNFPFKIKEQDQHVMSVVPYLSVGCWLPLGKDRNTNKPFSISVGNDGFTGITADGSIALDFPGMFQLSGGGGISFYMPKNYASYRIPTNVAQVGLIPWTTPISRDPGPIWYANISLKAENFSPGFSGFFDFTYTEHLKDKITIKDPNSQRAALFLPAVAEERSGWKAQQATAGFIYNITNNMALAVAVQGTIGGNRTYRPTTVLGSLIALF